MKKLQFEFSTNKMVALIEDLNGQIKSIAKLVLI